MLGDEVSRSSPGYHGELADLLDFDSLAYCEINLIIAALFHPGAPEFELYETDESDVKPAHDLIVPLPSLESQGVRAKFI